MERIEILKEDGSVENSVIGTQEWAEETFPGRWRLAEPVAEPEIVAVRHISVGAFFDRFGALKLTILRDQNYDCKAVVMDASVRKYIDLDNPELPAGLAILQAAGHDIDPDAILDAPIRPHELP